MRKACPCRDVTLTKPDLPHRGLGLPEVVRRRARCWGHRGSVRPTRFAAHPSWSRCFPTSTTGHGWCSTTPTVRWGGRLQQQDIKLGSMFPYGDIIDGLVLLAAAPTLWNNLPLNTKQAPSVDIFKSHIKTHLFQLAYFMLLCKSMCVCYYFMLYPME